jgi:hypothetical protein
MHFVGHSFNANLMLNFVSENRAVYEKMLKNIVQAARLQMTYKEHALCVLGTQATDTRTHRMCNTYRFSTAINVRRARINVTSTSTLLVFFICPFERLFPRSCSQSLYKYEDKEYVVSEWTIWGKYSLPGAHPVSYPAGIKDFFSRR